MLESPRYAIFAHSHPSFLISPSLGRARRPCWAVQTPEAGVWQAGWVSNLLQCLVYVASKLWASVSFLKRNYYTDDNSCLTWCCQA